MYLGEHYPSDVLVGAAIGTGSAYLSQWLYEKMFVTKKKKNVRSYRPDKRNIQNTKTDG